MTTGESVAYTYDLDGRMWTADIARTEKDSNGNAHDVAAFTAYRYAGGIRVANDSHTNIDGGTGLTTTRRYILDAGFTGYAQV